MNSLLWRWLARASMNWILFAQKFIFSVQSLFWPTSKHTICNDNIIRWFATCLQNWKKKKRKQKSYSLILSSSCADCHSMFASIHFVSMFFLRSHNSQREMNINKYGMRHAKSTTTTKKKKRLQLFSRKLLSEFALSPHRVPYPHESFVQTKCIRTILEMRFRWLRVKWNAHMADALVQLAWNSRYLCTPANYPAIIGDRKKKKNKQNLRLTTNRNET